MEGSNPAQMMEAIEGFATQIDGERIIVNAGRTRVAADHELAKRFPDRFQPIEASYAVESATDNPGEQRNRPRPQRAAATAGKS